MKRRYTPEVMQLRREVMQTTGVELSPAEAEMKWLEANRPDAVPKCVICGKVSTELKYKCCSMLCFLKRIAIDPKAAEEVERDEK